jgi:hypothetical protein
MERQHQELGGRFWRGEALLKLQNQLYQVFIETYRELGAFIISGCNVSAGSSGGLYDISAGYVFVDNDICIFEGAIDTTGPVYLNKQEVLTSNELYNDGISKPTEKHVKAVIGTDSLPYIEIALNNTTRRLPQAIAPISDSLSLISSTVYASATAVSNCYGSAWVKVPEILNNTATPLVGIQDVWYKKTGQLIIMDVQILQLDNAGPWTWQLPAGYFPTRTVKFKLKNALSDYVLTIDTGGLVLVSGAGNISITPQEHVMFSL